MVWTGAVRSVFGATLVLCASAAPAAAQTATYFYTYSVPEDAAVSPEGRFESQDWIPFLFRSTVTGAPAVGIRVGGDSVATSFGAAVLRPGVYYADVPSSTFLAAPQPSPCGRPKRRFVLYELEVGPVAASGDGPVLALSYDYEVACEGARARMGGVVRYRARRTTPLIAQLTMDSPSPVTFGAPVTLSLAGEAGTAPLEFRFWHYRQSTGVWTIVQDYGPLATWEWAPTAADAGSDHYFQVWIRSKGSANAWDDYRSLGPISVAVIPAVVDALVPDTVLPAPSGTRVRWKAAARGGTAPLEYRFWHYSSRRNAWTIERDWSSDREWVWQSTPLDEGMNAVQVWVRSSGSLGSWEAYKSVTFDLGRPTASYVLVTSTPGEPLFGGRQIFTGATDFIGVSSSRGIGTTISATSLLADPPHQVKIALSGDYGLAPPPAGFYEDAHTMSWSPGAGLMVEGAIDGTTVSCPFTTPEVTATGRYVVLENTSDRFAADVEFHCPSRTEPLFVAVRNNSTKALVNLLSFTSNGPATVGPGADVTWTAVASSGTGRVEYRFWRYNAAQGAWSIVQDWSPDQTFSWTPESGDTGVYYFQVWARTAGQSISYEAYQALGPFTVAAGPLQVYAFNVSDRPVAGEPVRLEAIAGGGSGVIEYRFWAYDYRAGSWTILRDYERSNTFEWRPPVTGEGRYGLQVWVRQAGSSVEYEAWRPQPVELARPDVAVLAGGADDPVSGGQLLWLTRSTSQLKVEFTSTTSLIATAHDGSGTWELIVAPPPRLLPEYRLYEPASPIGPNVLSIRNTNTTCASSQGKFYIHQFYAFPGSSSNVFAAIDFEQLCEGSTTPLYGGIRFRSDVPLVYAKSVQTVGVNNVPVGGTIAISGIGSSALGPVEYSFYARRNNSFPGPEELVLVRDFGPSSTYTWTTTSRGSYCLRMLVRRQGSTVAYDSFVDGGCVTVF